MYNQTNNDVKYCRTTLESLFGFVRLPVLNMVSSGSLRSHRNFRECPSWSDVSVHLVLNCLRKDLPSWLYRCLEKRQVCCLLNTSFEKLIKLVRIICPHQLWRGGFASDCRHWKLPMYFALKEMHCCPAHIRSILMWLYSPVDLTGNVNMIEKLVLGWDWNQGPPDPQPDALTLGCHQDTHAVLEANSIYYE